MDSYTIPVCHHLACWQLPFFYANIEASKECFLWARPGPPRSRGWLLSFYGPMALFFCPKSLHLHSTATWIPLLFGINKSPKQRWIVHLVNMMSIWITFLFSIKQEILMYINQSINKTIFHENNISVKCPNSQSLRARSPQTFRQKIRRRVNRNRIWG